MHTQFKGGAKKVRDEEEDWEEEDWEEEDWEDEET
jgi:hypothetical protein